MENLTHSDTCDVFEHRGRTFEIDDLSRSGGMDGTYAVYEGGAMLGEFAMDFLGQRWPGTIREAAIALIDDEYQEN